jgi:protein-L-isoaspartate(D-aspartate) O-methyltransferase
MDFTQFARRTGAAVRSEVKTMNTEQARFNMVEQQIRPWEVLDQDVLDLLMSLKREEFVPAAARDLAFADLEIPLGYGESMLPPKLEARILQEVAPRPSDSVLEVGTGSGYMAALLAGMAKQVTSVEIRPQLKAMGEKNLRAQEVLNVTVELGDAALGWAAHAPYDVIVLTGSTPLLPDSLLAQLKVGGRLFAIVGDAPLMEARLVTCVAEGVFRTVNLFETCVQPLLNAAHPERFVF